MSSVSDPNKYYVPEGSWWPLISTIALFVIFLGAALTFNFGPSGSPILILGFILLLIVFIGWFGVVIKESENGMYNSQVDVSFRMGMSCFLRPFLELFIMQEFTPFLGLVERARERQRRSFCGLTSKRRGPCWPHHPITVLRSSKKL